MLHICHSVSDSKEIILKNFGQHIKNLRMAKNLTQVEVSSAMVRDQQSLQRVESGRVNPSLTYLLDLAKALQIDPKDLLDFEEETSI